MLYCIVRKEKFEKSMRDILYCTVRNMKDTTLDSLLIKRCSCSDRLIYIQGLCGRTEA